MRKFRLHLRRYRIHFSRHGKRLSLRSHFMLGRRQPITQVHRRG